jgi:ribulose-5-phosphate 4-epimerase/fuculose-1-phosphate aldolase
MTRGWCTSERHFQPGRAIDATRVTVARLHGELTRYGLVVWTGGNVSGRVPGADLFVIKPSGVSYAALTRSCPRRGDE